MSFIDVFVCELWKVDPKRRNVLGSSHLEVVKEACINVKALVACGYQLQLLNQVETLMCYGRCVCEHNGQDPPQLSVEQFNAQWQRRLPEHFEAKMQCGRLAKSVREKIADFTATRKQFLLGDLEAAISVIESGLDEDIGLFSCHSNLFWLLTQCLAILKDHRDILRGVLGHDSLNSPMSLKDVLFLR